MSSLQQMWGSGGRSAACRISTAKEVVGHEGVCGCVVCLLGFGLEVVRHLAIVWDSLAVKEVLAHGTNCAKGIDAKDAKANASIIHGGHEGLQINWGISEVVYLPRPSHFGPLFQLMTT